MEASALPLEPEPAAAGRRPRRPTTTIETADGPVAFAGRESIDDLDFRTRAIIASSVVPDLWLRTGLATAMFGSGLVWGLTPGAWKERERLRFYRELRLERDPRVVFPRPAGEVTVRATRAAPWSFRAPGGKASLLTFDSPFTAVNPAMRSVYSRHSRNMQAWAQYWRHDDGPRPTLCVIHGFAASMYVINSAFFALPWLYGKGYDVLLYVMPFHGPRRDLLTPLNGAGLFAHGPSEFNEAIFHAVHDFRVFVDHLESEGVEHLGLTGLSIGGYMTALLATIEDRLEVAIPNAPVTDIPRLIGHWFPANFGVKLSSLLHRVPVEEATEALDVHSPLARPPLLPRERLMIIGGLGDRLAPPSQSRLLWEHWQHPRLHWYPGNHILHVNRAAYLREMRRFMVGVGFAPGS